MGPKPGWVECKIARGRKPNNREEIIRTIEEEKKMSHDHKGVGEPSPIVPSTHRKGNFLLALLIEIPFVLFFSTLIGISVAWFLVMLDNYGMDRMPGLLVSIFERQGIVMLSLPIILISLYLIITKVKK